MHVLNNGRIPNSKSSHRFRIQNWRSSVKTLTKPDTLSGIVIEESVFSTHVKIVRSVNFPAIVLASMYSIYFTDTVTALTFLNLKSNLHDRPQSGVRITIKNRKVRVGIYFGAFWTDFAEKNFGIVIILLKPKKNPLVGWAMDSLVSLLT